MKKSSGAIEEEPPCSIVRVRGVEIKASRNLNAPADSSPEESEEALRSKRWALERAVQRSTYCVSSAEAGAHPYPSRIP